VLGGSKCAAQKLHDRRVRQSRLVLVALRRQNRRALSPRGSHQLEAQTRLADAGLALDHGEDAALDCRAVRCQQGVELGVASHQR
jgi:hypothetical protein